MKYLALILVLATPAFTRTVQLEDGIVPKILPAVDIAEDVLPQVAWEHIRDIVLTNGELKADVFEANVTPYVYELMNYIEKFIKNSGLDPLGLANQTIKLIPTGTVTLSNGRLEGFSTLNVSSSVVARYSKKSKILDLTLPISLDTLLITYDYVAKITLIKINGGIKAKVSNVKLNLHLGFNFSSVHAFVDKADIKNTGKIDFTFTGLGLLDWIIDLLSDVLTTLFHGIIVSIINSFVQSPVEAVVNVINKLIDQLLERNATSFVTF